MGVPSTPGKPTFSNVLPTTVTVSWSGSSDNGGSAITGYLLRYWPNAAGTGPYTDHSEVNNQSRNVTGLTPGVTYRFVVYAKNSSGYSSPSTANTVRMLSAAWGKVSGVWKRAVPYVKVSGVWKMAIPYVKVSGVWKSTY